MKPNQIPQQECALCYWCGRIVALLFPSREFKMKQEWEFRQKHYRDIDSLQSKDGIHRDKKGFLRKYEGAKVQVALNLLGHSCLTYDKCSCHKGI